MADINPQFQYELVNNAGWTVADDKAYWDTLDPQRQAAIGSGGGDFDYLGEEVTKANLQRKQQKDAATYEAKKAGTYNPNDPTGADTAAKGRRASIDTEIQKFYTKMNTPSFNQGTGKWDDPLGQSIAAAGQSAAANNMGGGVQSMSGGANPFAANSLAAGVRSSLVPYEQGKQGMANQALGLMSNRQQSNEQLDQGWTNIKNQVTANNNAQRMGQGQAIGGLVGGLAGGAASFIPGMSAFAPQLVQGGTALGAGIGGMGAPQQQQSSYYSPGYKGGGSQ